jgi:16S rRNA C967 or C1407 C5-methylase (RsmB/RsmF family)
MPASQAWDAAPALGPFLSLTPASHDTDGFFGAVLARAAA